MYSGAGSETPLRKEPKREQVVIASESSMTPMDVNDRSSRLVTIDDVSDRCKEPDRKGGSEGITPR